MSSPARAHRVQTVRGSVTVTVEIDGTVVAKSSRPVVLFEAGLPVRYYLPPGDVDLALFAPTDTRTTCPFKGEAHYWAYRGPDGTVEDRPDVAWSYPDPLDAAADIAGHLSFYDTRARITVEGDTPAPPAA
ncbi:DUF427 domain-containing protein [Kitasatospora sp. NPDC049285]|uniref:DUF427 domain-containing protein n=1 Tax=Kitasatospora sp. NPDC049285 TaxID=3157096 RepID=UPI003445BC24